MDVYLLVLFSCDTSVKLPFYPQKTLKDAFMRLKKYVGVTSITGIGFARRPLLANCAAAYYTVLKRV